MGKTYGDDEFDDLLDVETKPTTSSGMGSVYDQLRQELGKPAVSEKTFTKKIPLRPSVELKFSTDLPLEKLDRWRQAARKKKNRDEVDIRFFNQLVIASQCVGIIFNGEEATDEAGKALTFRHQGLIDSLNALDVYGAVTELIGRDSDILKIGDEVLSAAGYDDEDDMEDDETDPLDLV